MHFLVTGTRAYGPANKDSDLDIVVLYKDVQSITNFLIEHNISAYSTPEQEDYGDLGGFYFNLADIRVNIIIAHDEAELALWNIRTEKMKKLPYIEDRATRLAVFKLDEIKL